jgi:hypothetical protein
LICSDEFGGGAIKNICDTSSLAYDCVCDGGGRPSVNEYTQTIYYFTCTYDQQECVHGCVIGDASCTSGCEAKYQCGAARPKHRNGTIAIAPQLGGNESASPPNIKPHPGKAEQLKPIPNGGMTFLSASSPLASFNDYVVSIAIVLMSMLFA